MKPIYTITRSGDFTINLVPNNKCGIVGQQTFRYECEIKANALDSNGFVIDNFLVQKRFAHKFSKGVWHASCEELAGGAIYLMNSLTEGRALAITCTIIPMSDAKLKIEWRQGWDMPEALPRKVEEPKAPEKKPVPAFHSNKNWNPALRRQR